MELRGLFRRFRIESINLGVGLALFLLGLPLFSYSQQLDFKFDVTPSTAPEWAHDGAIYEVSIPEVTSEGTFKAFQKELPRLKTLGVNIIWLMPIHERGKFRTDEHLIDSLNGARIPIPEEFRIYEKRKSPYGVNDYYSINAEYGTAQDLKDLIEEAHRLGMHVILDWVINHTAWGHVLVEKHPEFYHANEDGIVQYAAPWKDIAELDYENKELWEYMISMSKHWIKEFGIDGFRTDVADRIPAEFWEEFNSEMEKIKPIFMVAEGFEPENHPAHDATYDWWLPTVYWEIMEGKRNVAAIDGMLAREQLLYPKGFLKMRHATNHDTRYMGFGWASWAKHYDQAFDFSFFDDSSITQKFGAALKPYMILCATLPNSIPMIWNGQEYGKLEGGLANLDKENTEWPLFYTKLFELYKTDPTLRKGQFSRYDLIENPHVYAFTRSYQDGITLVMLNLSDEEAKVSLTDKELDMMGKEFFDGEKVDLSQASTLTMEAWGFKVYQFKKRPALTIIKENEIPSPTIASHVNKVRSGNTSLAFDGENKFKWSGPSPYNSGGWGYFLHDGAEVPYIKRDRDLGQTFLFEEETPKYLQSITVQTGFGYNTIREATYGKDVAIQIFEVQGSTRLNSNSSEGNTRAYHGWPHDRSDERMTPEKDDYLVGEKYKSVKVIRGYTFPSQKDFGFSENETIDPNHKKIKGQYLKFDIPKDEQIIMQPGKTYAFLIMIENMTKNAGFTLANLYKGTYEHGHGIRRDGNGVFPPERAYPSEDFDHQVNRKAMEAAHFPQDFDKRAAISPGTNGYPDVDTWRDLVFYIEAVNQN